MKKNFTSISMVLDRSGSMRSTLESTIEGFNTFIEEQREKAVGECVVSLHQFDNQYKTDYEVNPIAEVPELDTISFVPRGSTALLDAIGKTIDELGKSLSEMAEDLRPDTVIVVILTDGGENASVQYSMQQISNMIRHQTDTYDWEFVFIGANQDAIATASQFGIERQNAMRYRSDHEGTRAAFRSMSSGLRNKRSIKAELYNRGESIKEAALISKNVEVFTEDDRKEQDDKD